MPSSRDGTAAARCASRTRSISSTSWGVTGIRTVNVAPLPACAPGEADMHPAALVAPRTAALVTFGGHTDEAAPSTALGDILSQDGPVDRAGGGSRDSGSSAAPAMSVTAISRIRC